MNTETGSISSKEALGLAQCLDKFVESFLEGCCCCVVKKKEYDPFVFTKNDPRYYSWMGFIHIKRLVRLLIYIKSFLFFVFFISVLFMKVPALFVFVAACTVAFFTAMATYGILFTGIKLQKFHYFIPYFFTSFIFIIIMILQFFVDFLDSANTHDTLTSYRLSGFLVEVFAIAFEVYSLISTWRLFIFICDCLMDDEMHGKPMFHTLEQIEKERRKEKELETQKMMNGGKEIMV